MAGPNAGRRGAQWVRLKTAQRAKHLPCWRCGQPINYTLQWPDPGSYSTEHKLSRSTHPHLAEEPSNLGSSHLLCNQEAGNRETKPSLGTTSRDW